MIYVIPQENYKNAIFHYMDKLFNSYEIFEHPNFENSLFYVLDNHVIAEIILYPNSDKIVFILDHPIWEQIYDIFSFEKTSHLQKILKEWVEIKFNKDVIGVDFAYFRDFENEFFNN